VSIFVWFQKLFQNSPRQVVGAACGFLCAVFVLVIGFWNSVLILFLTLLGLAIGCLMESGWNVAACLRRLRGRGNDGEE
jgi:uncharacterized membrane protein